MKNILMFFELKLGIFFFMKIFGFVFVIKCILKMKFNNWCIVLILVLV